MAIMHGKAGQYGKSMANRRAYWEFMVIVFIGVSITGAWGFVCGYFWSRWGFSVALLAFLTAELITLVMWRRFEPILDKYARTRIKYMRGGQVEGLVAYLLQEQADASWHLFNGLHLERQSDIDHVLIGPGGVFCISTKSHRGIFVGTANGLRYNGEDSEFAQAALRQAMNVKDRLAAMMGNDVPWIQSVLAVPFGFVQGDACGGKVWVVHQDDLADRLAPSSPPKKLNNQQIERVVKVMEMIQQSAADVYERPVRIDQGQ